MIFSEKGRGAPFLRKNHPLNQQCQFLLYQLAMNEQRCLAM
jgi:hypothetical protein